MKPIIFFISIFFFALVIRFTYVRSHPPQIMPDTYGYYLIGQRIANQQLPVFNPQRTPGYPLFLQTAFALVGQNKSEINSLGFWNGAAVVTFMQTILSSIGVTLLTWYFYRLASPGVTTRSSDIRRDDLPADRQARQSLVSILTIILGLLLSSNILTITWDSILVVESLATSWLVLSSVWLYITLTKPTRGKILGLIILGWFGFLLKPVFVGVPIIWILFWGRETTSLRGAKNELRGNPNGLSSDYLKLKMLFITCLYFLLPLFYFISNYYVYNYLGINHVQDINLLGRVIKDKLDPTAGINTSPELTRQLSEYQRSNNSQDPYTFLQSADPTLLTDDTRQTDRNRLKPWVSAIILNNFPQYLTGVIRDIPRSVLALQGETLQNRPAYGWILVIFTQLILILTIPAFIYWRKKISPNTSIILMLHLSIWYLLLVTVAFGYGEYDRLMTPIQPVVYFLGLWWIYKIINQKSSAGRRIKMENYNAK